MGPVQILSYSEERLLPPEWQAKFGPASQPGQVFEVEPKVLDLLNQGKPVELSLSARSRPNEPLEILVAISSPDVPAPQTLALSESEKVASLEVAAASAALTSSNWLDLQQTSAKGGRWVLSWNASGPHALEAGTDSAGGTGLGLPKAPQRPKLKALKLITGKPVKLDLSL